MSFVQSIRSLLRKDFLSICAVVFCADLVAGVVSPTFSIYANSLGASLTLIGVLSSAIGVTQLLSAMPIGMQSDRIGRKRLIILGSLCFATAPVLFALSPNPWFLFPGRIVSAIAFIASFQMGAAYVGDIIRPQERSLAFGLYTTCMGLGFSVGPLFGSAIAESYGIRGSYLGASVIGLLGAAIGVWGLRETRGLTPGIRSRPVSPAWREMGWVLKNPVLLAGCVGNLVLSIIFNGVVINFFPLYLTQLGATQLTVNSMYSARSLISTATRLPTGILTSRVSTWLVMLVAMLLGFSVVTGMSITPVIAVLAILLILDGVAQGTFMTAGQTFVAENSTPATRGLAVGVYSTAGSLGTTVSPIVLGAVADIFGLQAVFRVGAAFAFVGIVLFVYIYLRHARKPANATL